MNTTASRKAKQQESWLHKDTVGMSRILLIAARRLWENFSIVVANYSGGKTPV
jgi:hypothetical protein